MPNMWIWIVVGIVVLVVVVGLVVMLTNSSKKKQLEHDRAEAARMREEAAEHERKVRGARADASAADAESRSAQAEAERASAEAKVLAAQADQGSAEAERRRIDAERLQGDVHDAERAHEEQLRAADAKDPDIRTDKDGNRIEDRTGTREGDRNRAETVDGVAGSDVSSDGDDRGTADHVATPPDAAYVQQGQTERPYEPNQPVEGDGYVPRDEAWTDGDGQADVVVPAETDTAQRERSGFSDEHRDDTNRSSGTDHVDGPPLR